jgi:hypothetical protein
MDNGSARVSNWEYNRSIMWEMVMVCDHGWEWYVVARKARSNPLSSQVQSFHNLLKYIL